MASDLKGVAVVLMGVSGAGKSMLCHSVDCPEITVGEMLAKVLDCCFIEADDFHSQSNKEKMHSGIPLTDEDRVPWLESLRDALRKFLINGKTVILGCSALKRQYRDILRLANPFYEEGTCTNLVKFVLLDVNAEVLAARLERRSAEGKHFMPAMLLQSQLDSLQIDDSEGIRKVDATPNPEAIVSTIKALMC